MGHSSVQGFLLYISPLTSQVIPCQ
jgi:hypothetical protein